MKFDDGNFSSLLAKAKKENKLIFLDAYASWCGPCKLMAKISLHYNLLATIITAIL
ncbi:thioredoxin domain-containing protein [Elizabethkingia anophelis]|uniref:thioredoxin domain-containing protein n=1 Tax=Elizabethkingia anophelis TaxID=1117645 RepID=UPI0021B223B4|nr:thioredoxin domain-containing protein [Elizabethkingia anophelis]